MPDFERSRFRQGSYLSTASRRISSAFRPFPGFSPDIYADYSVPAFGACKVLRGGAWITRARMINNTYRNYFPPGRRDIYAGFRTVAL